MRASLSILAGSCLASLAAAQTPGQVTFTNASSTKLRTDNGTYGPVIEEVHYYNKYWPIGISVASDGRLFASYTRGSYDYTLGVIVNKTAEAPFPTSGPVVNAPANALNTSWHGIDFGPSNASQLVNVQALYITPATGSRPETLWVLDTGRPTIHSASGDPSMPYSQPGGPKLVAINITSIDGRGASGRHNDTAYRTYTFPSTVHYPDSYMNDLRFDLRSNLSDTNGEGIAYINDSSNEGRPGFIMVDLATGDSWRRLTEDPTTLRGAWDVPSYTGRPYYFDEKGMPVMTQPEGLDGIQLSRDLSRMYYSPLTSRELYSVPTANLRIRPQDPLSELAAHGNISHHGTRGGDANGFEGDSDGRIYMCMPTQNAIYYYDPRDLQTHAFVRDPRIIWNDGASVGADGYIYMNINQLFDQADWNNGTDHRTFPGAILRAKLPGNATKLPLGSQ